VLGRWVCQALHRLTDMTNGRKSASTGWMLLCTSGYAMPRVLLHAHSCQEVPWSPTALHHSFDSEHLLDLRRTI
jgi:hypothetical protein